jgi:restriction endonuclease S subunit
MENYKTIDKNWQTKTLEEVCEEIFAGGDVPKNNFSKIKTEQFQIPIFANGEKNNGFYGYTNIPRVTTPAVTVSARGTIGFALVRNNSFFPIVRLIVLKPKEEVAVKFLKYSIDNLNIKHTGSSIPQLTVPTVKLIKIPIPNFEIQTLIVSKIEELFSELDKGIEDLKTAQQQLKTYRQSVLKYAFEGRLTNKKIKDGDLPKGWEWVKSESFFDFVTSGSRGWAKYYSEKGAIFIRITNLNFDSLVLDLQDKKIQYVNPPSNSEGIRTKVQEGDFLFSITGYLGMFAIAPKLDNAYVNQHVCLCRPNNNFNKKYLGYWIVSKSGGHYYLNKNQKGAVKAGLNLSDLKEFPVPLCSIEEQNIVVKEIESRLSVADKMEESIGQSLLQAEALRQSILKKAFTGELI